MELVRRAVLALGATVLALAALEGACRLGVRPSPRSAGRLFGSELPPVRLVPPEPPLPAARTSRPGAIRFDDLTGLVRDDVALGYVPRERAISTNGWWQSNNLGARARHDTDATIAPGTTRVLVFGDSFASGSRVAQESAWPSVLEASAPGLEVVSFGVDGYGLAQSWLRYRALAPTLAHDVVVLAMSPRADLERDVNVLRALLGWRSYRIMPRFVLDPDFHLVPSPYDPPSAIHADNRDAPSAMLREHLRRYDRFYVPWMYEPTTGLASHSVLAKLAMARWHAAVLDRRHAAVLDPGSEAVAVSARIVATMRAEATAHGAGFLLALLPSELETTRLRRRPGTRAEWNAIAAAVAGDVPHVDLADALIAAPDTDVDRGFDGTHHGPRANAVIAAAMSGALPPRRPPAAP